MLEQRDPFLRGGAIFRRAANEFDLAIEFLHEPRFAKRRQCLHQLANNRFQRFQRFMFVLNQITDRVSLLEPKHGPDLIDIAASVEESLRNRSSCGKC